MRNRNVTIWVMAATVLCFCTPQVLAAIFNNGGTHDITWATLDDVDVSQKTTVNLLSGGSIGGNLRVYDNSIVTVSGEISYYLLAYDGSQVSMYCGSTTYLQAHGNSEVDIFGGSIGSHLIAADNSIVTLSGGSIGDYLLAKGNSRASISGGSMSDLLAYDSSQVTVSGGSIGLELKAEGSAILTIHGSDFSVDGQPFGYGELTSMLHGYYGNEPHRYLTGILASGDLLNNDFRIGNDASIVLVPEPATLLLLGLGAVMLRRKG